MQETQTCQPLQESVIFRLLLWNSTQITCRLASCAYKRRVLEHLHPCLLALRYRARQICLRCVATKQLLRSQAIIFDVNETLFGMAAFEPAFEQLGLRSDQVQVRRLCQCLGLPCLPPLSPLAEQTWFLSVLRDGMGLAAAGDFATFRDIGRHAAEALLRAHGLSAQRAQEGAATILAGFDSVAAHPDVAEGLRKLHELGITVRLCGWP